MTCFQLFWKTQTENDGAKLKRMNNKTGHTRRGPIKSYEKLEKKLLFASVKIHKFLIWQLTIEEVFDACQQFSL